MSALTPPWTKLDRLERVTRRLGTISAIAVGLPALIASGPLIALLGVAADLRSGHRGLPTVRLWLFGVVFLAHEWIGQIYAIFLWVTGGFGRRLHHGRHRGMQSWWVASLFRWARRLLGVEVELDDLSDLPNGELVVLSRHASMVDALIPALIWASTLNRPVHYVLKKELRFIPNIDVYGHRLGNHFVDRVGDRDAEVAAIAGMARGARPRSALVIFPEGTYATEAAKKRIQLSLERRGETGRAKLNKELRYLLPPRPGGALALLDERPTAPVVIVGHVGLEGLAELDGLRRHLPSKRKVCVRWWIIDRADVPDDDEGRKSWLDNEWRKLDQWVASQQLSSEEGSS